MKFLPVLNRADRDRLRRFISLHEARLAREEEVLALLNAKLERGHRLESEAIPDDVVTMNSRVRMRDADSGRVYETTVAVPMEANSNRGGSLLGAFPRIAPLGGRVGDHIVWRFAGRLRRARIEQLVFRPELPARGNHGLRENLMGVESISN